MISLGFGFGGGMIVILWFCWDLLLGGLCLLL